MSDFRNRLLAAFAEQQGALTRFLARRLGRMAIAEELAQETWIRAALAGGAVPLENPRTYLFRIAANLALDHLRHDRLGVELSLPSETVAGIADPAPSPEAVAAARSELAAFLRAIQGMPRRTREVFLLTKVDGLSYAEVAARLGIARNTVMVHMSTALRWLDRHLPPEIADRR